jgi:hypothetical protein
MARENHYFYLFLFNTVLIMPAYPVEPNLRGKYA